MPGREDRAVDLILISFLRAGFDEKLNEKRMEIMTKAALPSSSGRQTSFAGLKAERVLKKTALDQGKIGVVAKKSTLVPDYNSSSSENEET